MGWGEAEATDKERGEGSETMKVVCPECRKCDIFKAFDRNDKLFFQCTSCNAIIKTNLSWRKRRRK